MENVALYKCPYCPKTFSSVTEGWDNATQHIKVSHRGRGSKRKTSFSDNAPRDNLFGDVGSSPQTFSV